MSHLYISTKKNGNFEIMKYLNRDYEKFLDLWKDAAKSKTNL